MSAEQWNQILAIDIDSRVPNFYERAKNYSHNKPLCFKTIIDAMDSFAADALLVSIHQKISEDALKQFPALAYLGVLGTSLKQVPLEYCQAHNIIVKNVTDYCDHDTAEWVVLKALEFLRNRPKPQSAFQKTWGIIGVGAVSKKVFNIVRGLHMHVLINSAHAHPELLGDNAKDLSKEEIFAHADIVSIHTPAFLQWLTKDILRKARKNLCIINTCMGKISAEFDLEEVLLKRPDITLIMDKIAGDNYPELKGRAQIHSESAFNTVDAEERLINKFFDNLTRSA